MSKNVVLSKKVVVDNIEYPSVKAACKSLGLPYDSLRGYRLRHNITFEEAIRRYRAGLVAKGVSYDDICMFRGEYYRSQAAVYEKFLGDVNSSCSRVCHFMKVYNLSWEDATELAIKAQSKVCLPDGCVLTLGELAQKLGTKLSKVITVMNNGGIAEVLEQCGGAKNAFNKKLDQTSGVARADPMGVFTYDNMTFKSLREIREYLRCANATLKEAFDTTDTSLSFNKRMTLACDEVKRRKRELKEHGQVGTAVTYNGVSYNSIAALARGEGISLLRLNYYRNRKGFSLDAAVSYCKTQAPIVRDDGPYTYYAKEFIGINQLVEFIGCSRHALEGAFEQSGYNDLSEFLISLEQKARQAEIFIYMIKSNVHLKYLYLGYNIKL